MLPGLLFMLATVQSAPDIMPSGGDDTARLQRLIGTSAREASDRTIVLGPGTFLLSEGIDVPPGTKNLSIRGAGMDRTILRDTSGEGINRLLQIGWDIQSNSNYNIRPKSDHGSGDIKNTLVAGAKEGESTLRVLTGPADPAYTGSVAANRWYLLYDNNEIVHYQGSASILNHAEPVFITRVQGGIATLQRPLGRDFPGAQMPRLAHIGDKFCHNISVAGLTINSVGKERSYNMLPVHCTIGFKASGMKVEGFRQNAIIVQDSRDYEIADCEILTSSDGATNSGYGIVAGRGSWNGKVHDIRSHLIRGHGYTLVTGHGGGSDMECWNVRAPGGKLDIHGMDSLRITFRDSEVADLHLGNNQWMAAGKGHRAENIKCSSLVWVQAGAKDVVLRKVEATGVVLNSQMGDEGGNPANGYPEDVTFEGCKFADQDKFGLILGEEGGNKYRGRVGRVVFRECSFSNRDSKYGGILLWHKKFEGEMRFEGCAFRTDTAPFFEAMVRVSNKKGMRAARLTFDSCTFMSSHKDTDYAIGLGEWENGLLRVRNSTLATPKGNASVLAPGVRAND